MKLLVVGKEGKLERYTKDASLLEKYEISRVPMGASDEEILAAGKDADFILVDAMGKISAKVINEMPNLKMIHSEGVGFQGVDVNAAKEKKVYVCNCKGMNATAVAEQAVLLMMGLLRGIVTGDRAVREGRQIAVKESYMVNANLKELADCTIGLMGFGDIAKAVAKFARVFGAKVVYYDVFRASEEVEKAYDVTFMETDELLKVSDIVSMHLPVTPQTENMANAAFFAKMKKGSYIVNTARGELIDSAALLDAIRSGQIAGAGLDTVAGEPVQADNILLKAEKEVEDRIICSCHVGGITASSFQRGYDMVWDDIEKVAAGGKPAHVVNPW